MFTLWYIYLGYQEYRTQGYFSWLKQDNNSSDIPATPVKMESSTEKSDNSSSVDKPTKENENSESNEKLILAPTPTPAPVPSVTEKFKQSDFHLSEDSMMRSDAELGPKSFNKGLIESEKGGIKESESDIGKWSDEDLMYGSSLQAKDSKILISESRDKRIDASVESNTAEVRNDKKKISFTENDELQMPSNEDENISSRDSSENTGNDHGMSPSSIRSPNGRGRVFLEGSDEPMRCWLTEGHHPNHPAGMNMGIDNIKLISNRARDSADSILRDSDEFIMSERHVSRQTSWPKKVSISEDPPTTFIRDIPPVDNAEPESDDPPQVKIKREADLAAAAAAALKEDWRKKMGKKVGEATDIDDDENIIFGDSDENDDGQILQISDEESLSESGTIVDNIKYKMVDAAVLEKLETGFKKLQASDSKSLLKKYLTQEVFDKLKNLKTPTFGSTLLDVIQSGLENHDSGVGIYAPDAEAYTVFADLFDPIIEDYHSGFKKTDKHPARDFGDVDSFTNLDPAGEYIISTRVRCGRSMEGYPFNPCLTEAQYKEMEEKVSSTLSGLTGELKGNFYPLTGMTKEVQQKLIDDHFLFKEGDRFLQAANACRFWPTGRGIYHNDEKTFLVWCNEEDHLRIISMQMGGDLGQVYRRLVSAVNEIEKRVPFSHNDRLGFLTFCPTNLGTTIRASVHIKVPKLAANRTKLEEVAGKFNLQVRGTRGEHTEAEGGIYDISNKRRMGLTEYQAVKEMNDGIAELIKIEREL